MQKSECRMVSPGMVTAPRHSAFCLLPSAFCILHSAFCLFAVACVCLGLLAGGGCSRTPPRVAAPAINPTAAGRLGVEQYDADGDGLIQGDELNKAPALKSALENLDTNQDGGVSAEEIAERVKAWQQTKVGAMSLSCTVTYRGQPLQGATVKFVPEEFLGDEIQTATGQTNQFGVAVLNVPADPDLPGDVPGVQCGLYRVEITKQGADIPAIYNTQTILGQEVADDCAAVRRGIIFELK